MPVKHCIYKQESQPHYSAVAFENILTEEKGDYFTYPEESRDRFINCKSPVVTTWAEENKKGKLVAEVGFLSNTSKHFLRPKEQDPADETSAFMSLHKILVDSYDSDDVTMEDTKSPFFDIIMEPDLGAKYYQELQAYLLEGTDLNPYINETTAQNPGSPAINQIQLSRVLSYRIDENILSSELLGAIAKDGILKSRLAIMEAAIKNLKRQATGKELGLQFDWEARKLIDIGRTAQSIESNSDYPFFTQAYNEYYDQKEDSNTSFASFIKNHPATLYNRADSSFTIVRRELDKDIKDSDGILYNKDSNSLILVPYMDIKENFPAQLFRRFNEFADCIENQKSHGVTCDDIEEKRVFIETILTHYYTEALKDLQEDSSEDEDSSGN